MSPTNLEPIKQQILEIIQHDPDVKYLFLGWVTDQFASKTDLKQMHEDTQQLQINTSALLEEMKALREDSNHRFEAVQNEIKELREDSNRRFEAVQNEIKELREEGERRWDANEKRWAETLIWQHKMDQFQIDMESWKNHLNLTVGGLQNRAGENLENMVASVLRFGLKHSDIKPEHVKMRQKIVDTTGLIGKPGKRYEYDLLTRNGTYYVFEIRSGGGAKRWDIELLADKALLVQHHLQLPTLPQPVFVTLGQTDVVIQACIEFGVLLIA